MKLTVCNSASVWQENHLFSPLPYSKLINGVGRKRVTDGNGVDICNGGIC